MTTTTIRYEVRHFDIDDVLNTLHGNRIIIGQRGLYQVVTHGNAIQYIWLLKADEQIALTNPKFTINYFTHENTQHILWYTVYEDAQKVFNILSRDTGVKQVALCRIEQLVTR